MKNVRLKFERLIQRLNYSKIKITSINVTDLRKWCYANIPGVVKELKDLGHDLDDRDTWLETMFINCPMKWYDKTILLYVTSSYAAYFKAQQILKTKKFRQFRKDFNIDCHAAVLMDPIIFIKDYNLDDIYLSFDFDKGYSILDYSYYDEQGNLTEEVKEEWGWITNENTSSVLIDDPNDPENYYNVELWDEYKQKLIKERLQTYG